MDACTIIATNYLAYARVLASSFARHHPNARFTALVIDAPREHGLAEQFGVLTPYDLGLPVDEVHRMAVIYDIKELATAVKPFFLRHLLEEGAGEVAYFDPDIEVFQPLDEIGRLAHEHGIVLTPHTTEPMPRDGLLPDEGMILRAGVYNLGFVAVGEEARPFLDWWGERLARDCIVAVEQGLFVDQRWVDFVPSLFDHAILRDPGYNVAYWNLSYRRLERQDGTWTVNGQPLRFFHYSGFSPARGHVVSAHMGGIPRIELRDRPEVAELCGAYAEQLRANGFRRTDTAAYRFDVLPNGIHLDHAMRRTMREAIVESERTGEQPCPDPFDERGIDDFTAWLRDPDGSGVPRYLAALHRRRLDLQGEFPDPADADRAAYLDWAHNAARVYEGIPQELLGGADEVESPGPVLEARARVTSVEAALRRAARRSPALARLKPVYRAARRVAGAAKRRLSSLRAPSPRPLLAGVNVAGYLRAELGVGEAARRIVIGLEHARIPYSTFTYGHTLSRQAHPFRGRSGELAFDTNVVCVNADELLGFHRRAGHEFFAGKYTVGVWFWEVEAFPARFRGALEVVDEIWVGSTFVRDAITAATEKPVLVVPLPVEQPAVPPLGRTDVGLPEDRFVFLFTFDHLSVFERKNPLGLIEAFERAFEPNEGPLLVLKSINGDHDFGARLGLEALAAGRPDIRVVDEYVSAAERDALIAQCDCYVSLHRSEGYGLTMAEAMAFGKPVIATGYSGNLAFMDESNSVLVPYQLVPIGPGHGPYPAGARWADPDVEAAAEAMRRLAADPAEARRLGASARADILSRHSPERTARFLVTRLAQIRAGEVWRVVPDDDTDAGSRELPQTKVATLAYEETQRR